MIRLDTLVIVLIISAEQQFKNKQLFKVLLKHREHLVQSRKVL